MAEAVDIIETKLDSSALTQGTHVIQNGHVIGGEQGIKNYVSGLSASREEINAKLEALIKKQKDAAKAKNEDFNHSFIVLNIKSHNIELVTPQQADKLLQASPEIENHTASVTAIGAAGGVTLSAVDSAFKQHNPLADTIQGDPEVQPEEGAALTADKEGNSEYMELWDQVEGYDASIFATELNEDQLVTNQSFQDAARILFEESEGQTWEAYVKEKNWSAQRAKEELGEWGLSKAGDLAYKSWDAGKAALSINDKSPDVQLATLFMIQAFDHKDASAGSTLTAVGKSLADPVNIALMVGGFGLSFFSFGTSAAGASALVAARTAAASLARKEGIKAITQAVVKNVVSKQTISTLAKTSFARGAGAGAAEGLAHDYAIQHTLEEAGYNQLGREHEYSFSRGTATVLTSAALGGTLNEVASGLGRKVSKMKANGKSTKEAQTPDADVETKAELEADLEAKSTVDIEQKAQAGKDAAAQLEKDAQEKAAQKALDDQEVERLSGDLKAHDLQNKADFEQAKKSHDGSINDAASQNPFMNDDMIADLNTKFGGGSSEFAKGLKDTLDAVRLNAAQYTDGRYNIQTVLNDFYERQNIEGDDALRLNMEIRQHLNGVFKDLKAEAGPAPTLKVREAAPDTTTEADSNVVNIFNRKAQGADDAPAHAQTTNLNVSDTSSLDALARASSEHGVEIDTPEGFKVRPAGTSTRQTTAGQEPKGETPNGDAGATPQQSVARTTGTVAHDGTNTLSKTDTPKAETSTQENINSQKPPPTDTIGTLTQKHEKIISAPYRSAIHTIFDRKWNPYIRIKGMYGSDGGNPADWLPNDLAKGKFIREMVYAIDDTMANHKIPDVIAELQNNIEHTTKRIENGSGKGTPQDQVQSLLNDFADKHSPTLQKFSKDLDPFIVEIQFERDMARLAEQVLKDSIDAKRDAKGNRKPPGQKVINQAYNLIAEYEKKTLSKLPAEHKDSLITSIEKGGLGLFKLDSEQADAMIKYARHMQKTSHNLANPSSYGKEVSQRISDVQVTKKATSHVVEAISLEFHDITTHARNSHARRTDREKMNVRDIIPDVALKAPLVGLVMDPITKTASRALRNQKNREYKLEDADALIRMIDVGYYNDAVRTKPIVKAGQAPNSERFAMLIESMDRKKNTADEVITELLKGYGAGEEYEVLYALRQLQRRTGGNGAIDAIPAGVVAGMDAQPKLLTDGGEHYKAFVDKISHIANIDNHSPQKYGQRDILQIYANFTMPFRYARRFVGKGHIATPFRDDYWTKPRSRELARQSWRLLGAKDISITKDGDGEVLKPVFFSPLAEGETRGLRGTILESGKYVGRLGFNIATAPTYLGYRASRGLLINPITRRVALPYGATAVGLTGLEEGIEHWTDTEWNGDIGSRMLGGGLYAANYALTPVRWGLEVNNEIIGLSGYKPFDLVDVPHYLDLENHLIPWNASILGDRGNISPLEALEAIGENPVHTSYIYADVETAATAMADAGDIEQENIEGYLKAAQDARVKAQSAPQEQPVVNGKKDETSEKDSTSEGNKEKPNGSPEVRDSNSNSSTTFNNVADKGSDLLGSVGGTLSSIFEGAFPNSGISTALSSSFNWAGNTFSQMKSGQISNGQETLAYVGMGAAALMFVPWITSKLDFLGSPGNPSMLGGLLSIAGIFLAVGYGGRMVLDMMKGQSDHTGISKTFKKWTNSSGNQSKQNDNDVEDTGNKAKPAIPDTAVKKLGDGDTAYITEGAVEGDGKIGIGLVQNVVGQQKGKVISAPLAMQIVSAETAAANSSIASIQDLRNKGRIIKSDELGHYAGKDTAEGGGEVIDIGTGKQYSFHSLNGTMDDKDLVAVEYDLKAG